MQSKMTRKGQVTIPKAIRDRLGVRERRKVFVVMQGEEVALKIVKGTILDLRGSVQASAHPEDFKKIRQSVKLAVGKRVVRRG